MKPVAKPTKMKYHEMHQRKEENDNRKNGSILSVPR